MSYLGISIFHIFISVIRFLTVCAVPEYHILVLLKLMIATLSLQLVSYLGIVIFRALDFGLSDEEERHLSPDLERLIDMMTAAGKLPLPFSLVGQIALNCFGTDLFLHTSSHCVLKILHCGVRLCRSQ